MKINEPNIFVFTFAAANISYLTFLLLLDDEKFSAIIY